MRQVWDEQHWRNLDASLLRDPSWTAIVRQARTVLKTYSNSFFIVTRFLPPEKRAEVEVIYAAVRYPDEIVDTFPLDTTGRLKLLYSWADGYERALKGSTQGVPAFLTGFAQVVRKRSIPPEHYRAFLQAMWLDVEPRPYATMGDLIDSYIYGSAIVVGYFLAYVYGASSPAQFDRVLASSRSLGIALQLTNFLRDVGEDQRRGRIYLPQDLLRAEGIASLDVNNSEQLPAINRVLRTVSAIAEDHYAASERDLDAFSPDCVTAIRACIDVYRQLNLRIGSSAEGVRHRESVPLRDKFQVLPPSKYWRLPLAYLGAI